MDPVDLAFAGLARQAELVRGGEVSSRELVELSLARIARLDGELNAFRVVRAEAALIEADQADARRRGGDERPLLGVPVAVKDDADVAGESTLMGSSASSETPAARDSEAVRRLREAGAVVVGKTNVPELTQWAFTETARFGVTRNPWDRDRTPGGSSGGSAAAVAAGLVPAALGSDGAGSIRIPAACCGLFGIKPQRDRVPLTPREGQWHGLSVYGPLARRVADAALFLDVLTDGDGTFVQAALRPPRSLRIAVSSTPALPTRVDPEVRGAVDTTAELLRSLGHRVEERDPGVRSGLAHLLPRYLHGIHVEASGVAHPERLERRTRAMSALGRATAPLLRRSVRTEAEAHARLTSLWDDFDVLLSPILATLPVEVGRWEGRGALATLDGNARFVPFAGAWNVTGQPATAVPAGWSSGGLPLVVQLVGRPRNEATLISLSAQLEAERPWADRRPPVG